METIKEIIEACDTMSIDGGPLLTSWEFDGERLRASWVDEECDTFEKDLDIEEAERIGRGLWRIDGATVQLYKLNILDTEPERETVYIVVDDLGKHSQGVVSTPHRNREEAERHFVSTVNQVLIDEGYIGEKEEAENFEEAKKLLRKAYIDGLRGEITFVEETL